VTRSASTALPGAPSGPVDERSAVAAISHARSFGINLFDTVQAYGFGRAERLLGQALAADLRSARESVVIATKGGLRMDGENLVRDASPGWLRKGAEASLDALGTDHIDLYQVHWPDPATPIGETAAALAELVREGLIRHVGVSNYTPAQIDQFATVLPVETVQPPYHLFRRDIEADLLPYAAAHDIGVLAYGPLAHGLLGGAITGTTTFVPGDWRAHSPAFTGAGFARNLKVVAALRAFAADHGATIAQLAVAWVLARPAVQVAIVGARTPAHLAESVGALHLTLSRADLAEIDTIMAAAVPVGGPTPEGCHDHHPTRRPARHTGSCRPRWDGDASNRVSRHRPDGQPHGRQPGPGRLRRAGVGPHSQPWRLWAYSCRLGIIQMIAPRDCLDGYGSLVSGCRRRPRLPRRLAEPLGAGCARRRPRWSGARTCR
jgi:aryl-alcohol dehydrogenase-like predicted oxidoreductase